MGVEAPSSISAPWSIRYWATSRNPPQHANVSAVSWVSSVWAFILAPDKETVLYLKTIHHVHVHCISSIYMYMYMYTYSIYMYVNKMSPYSNYCLTTVVLNRQVHQLPWKLLLNYCSVEMKLYWCPVWWLFINIYMYMYILHTVVIIKY